MVPLPGSIELLRLNTLLLLYSICKRLNTNISMVLMKRVYQDLAQERIPCLYGETGSELRRFDV